MEDDFEENEGKHRGTENTEEEEGRSDARVDDFWEQANPMHESFFLIFFSVDSVPPCFKILPDFFKTRLGKWWDFEDLSAPYDPNRTLPTWSTSKPVTNPTKQGTWPTLPTF